MEFSIPDDLEALSERQLGDLIKQVSDKERKISDRRVKVQDRLDFLRGGAADSSAASIQTKLVDDEERISNERKQLHTLIDLLHAERHRRGRSG